MYAEANVLNSIPSWIVTNSPQDMIAVRRALETYIDLDMGFVQTKEYELLTVSLVVPFFLACIPTISNHTICRILRKLLRRVNPRYLKKKFLHMTS